MDLRKFSHWSVKLPAPAWGSPLSNKILELEKIRGASPNPESVDIFMELKLIFQQLENWASARIEGNQSRLLDALDPNRTKKPTRDMHLQELNNLEKAIGYIEEHSTGSHRRLTKDFILDLHKIVVSGLPIGEDMPGDGRPGQFRLKEIEITGSHHVPPMGLKIPDYIDELVEFINKDDGKINHLLKVAVFHHRFTWIHPFGNGNGRVVRLLTYSLLDSMGYGVSNGRVLNPTAIFFADRKQYYRHLAMADSGSGGGILRWCEYFLDGLLDEITKIDRLLDRQYLKDNLLTPVLINARASKRISDEQYQILRMSIHNGGFTFVAGDIDGAIGQTLSPQERSRTIRLMRQENIITVAYGMKQRYVIELWSEELIRYVVAALIEAGFAILNTADNVDGHAATGL